MEKFKKDQRFLISKNEFRDIIFKQNQKIKILPAWYLAAHNSLADIVA